MSKWQWNLRGHEVGSSYDYVEMKREILAFLAEAGPKRREEIEREFKGKPGASRVGNALRFLKEDGMIVRENNSAPWRIAGTRDPGKDVGCGY